MRELSKSCSFPHRAGDGKRASAPPEVATHKIIYDHGGLLRGWQVGDEMTESAPQRRWKLIDRKIIYDHGGLSRGWQVRDGRFTGSGPNPSSLKIS